MPHQVMFIKHTEMEKEFSWKITYYISSIAAAFVFIEANQLRSSKMGYTISSQQGDLPLFNTTST